MPLVRITRDPSRRQLVVFGLTWLLFLSLVGWMVWQRTHSARAAAGLWTAAVLVPVIGAIVPAFLRVLYVAVSYAMYPIAWAVSVVMLAVVFYLVLTPIGLLLRLFRSDPMARRFDREARTYWIGPAHRDETESYLRQF